MGYESNEVSVVTNVTSDHLDLQGIHTLPELAEVKSTVARVTKPDGWAVLNADDPLVAAIARRVRSHVALFSLVRRRLGGGSPERGGRADAATSSATAGSSSSTPKGDSRIVELARIPITIGGIARHNVANALAAAGGGARARGVDRPGRRRPRRRSARPSDRSPGRLNLYRLGARIVIVDFAHNEAGVSAVLDVAEGIAGGAAGRAAPITAIVGTAGDRPDDTLRGIARIAASGPSGSRSRRRCKYLRGRSRESIVGELLAGREGGGRRDVRRPGLRIGDRRRSRRSWPTRSGRPRVIVLLCHEEREEVFQLLESLGARPIDVATELTSLVPRLQERPAPSH